MLNKKQAATYCNMCVSNFDALCPVGAVEFKPRLKLYDRHKLDEWLDSLQASQPVEGRLASQFDDWHNGAGARR